MNAVIFAALAASRPLGLHGVIMIVAVVAAGLILARLLASRKEATAPAPVVAPEVPAPAPEAAPPTAATAGKVPASGSLGQVDLHTVDPRTAAMLMAIVADKMGAPLNELRFISIKEVGEL